LNYDWTDEADYCIQEKEFEENLPKIFNIISIRKIQFPPYMQIKKDEIPWIMHK